MNTVQCLTLAALVAGAGGSRPPQKGAPDMPMLKWAGNDKVANHHKSGGGMK